MLAAVGLTLFLRLHEALESPPSWMATGVSAEDELKFLLLTQQRNNLGGAEWLHLRGLYMVDGNMPIRGVLAMGLARPYTTD